MAINTSLYTIKSIIILDSDGKRLFVKYFKGPHNPNKEEVDLSSITHNEKKQLSFESNLFQKTHKSNSDIILLENQIVVYKEFADVIVYVTGDLNENEVLLYNALQGLIGALEIVIKSSMDKRLLQENYDMVSLTIDETVDDGIILETDPAAIASRVTKPPTEDITNIKLDLNEKTLFSAFNFARNKLSERIQQGF
ncbi:unnamed protein product [[Candida] boidinii]|uniref:Coatomer subunit zeta n=1 Tax=Candida boidinii TaxID=5477 RepID=A0A9W6SSP9_CANBO|nr:hypothetical protein BVG19_g690 [[Candida] boidinii]OWB49302.1 hypothetical protein B5S27_g842 [[Candida] boidinii]OWB67871.1 hypothetical protein B5S30_g3239 [[Candida] boidinii]OWB85384.1 hypothetical protein B5S33_g4049 [[Candida] boidinii]GME66561.1 unnamed protein product [[Candida] boidinii]